MAGPVPNTTGAAVPVLLPCLKEPRWRGREASVCRALWLRQSSQHMPWLAVGYDRPHTFEFIPTADLAKLNTTEQALEAQAVANLRARPAQWESFDFEGPGGKTLRMLVCSGDYFAAERILDADFMRQAQQTLGARGLLVGIPRRGILMVTSGEQDADLVKGFGAAVAGQFSGGESPMISPMIFAMKDGAIVGLIEAVADALIPDREPAADSKAGDGDLDDLEEEDEDPNAPYITVVVVGNEQGTEDVHLVAGGQDGDRLASGIEAAFMSVIQEHAARNEFSGHVKIAVLGMTPPQARKSIPKLFAHLRGLCAELSAHGKVCQVSLTYQRDAFAGAGTAPAMPPPTPPRGGGQASSGTPSLSDFMHTAAEEAAESLAYQDLTRGALATAGGLVLTLGSLFFPRGGRFWYGLVLYGLWIFFRGVVRAARLDRPFPWGRVFACAAIPVAVVMVFFGVVTWAVVREDRVTTQATLAAADAARAEQIRAESKVAREASNQERVARRQGGLDQALHRVTSRLDDGKLCDAALQLGRSGDKTYVLPLVNLLSLAGDSSIRGCAAGALVELGDIHTPLAAYVRWAEGSDSDLRRAALVGFGEIGPPAADVALPHLGEALKSPHMDIRYLAVDALAKLGPAAAPLLQTAAADADMHVRDRAADGLRALR